jgi:ferredoxin
LWDSKAGSLLDFAEANQIQINSGCRAENCRTSLIAIKTGDIELVGEPESSSCLAFISIPKDNLSLDT